MSVVNALLTVNKVYSWKLFTAHLDPNLPIIDSPLGLPVLSDRTNSTNRFTDTWLTFWQEEAPPASQQNPASASRPHQQIRPVQPHTQPSAAGEKSTLFSILPDDPGESDKPPRSFMVYVWGLSGGRFSSV